MQSRTRFYYALSNLGRTVFYSFFTGFLLSFVLYTRSLTTAQFSAVSVVLVAGRVFDAVIDPFIGGLIANTRSRFGRFKPWIFAGMVLGSAGMILTFALPLQGWAFVALLVAGNLAFSVFYSINDIAYWAMLPGLGTAPDDRAKLMSLTTLLGGVGGALAFGLTPVLTNGKLALGGSAVIAFPLLAVAASVMMCGMQSISLLGVKESEAAPLEADANEPRPRLGSLLRAVVRNDQLMWSGLGLSMHSLASGILSSGLSALFIYMRFGYAGILAPLATAGVALGGFAANGLIPRLHGKYGRARTMKMALTVFLASSAFVLATGLLIPDSARTLQFVTFAAGLTVGGFGLNCIYITLLICMMNTVEYNQYKTGKRQESVVLSVRPFLNQLGSALTGGIVTLIFLLLGLLPVTNGISDAENAAAAGTISEALKLDRIAALLSGANPAQVKLLLAALIALPCLFLSFGVLVWRKKYTIDEARYQEITEAIANGK
ncbi:MAG: MFS transporter [Oscillospiraceae bacterium]|nr:MFS transporter [Oscillospiraceae bacterium]